jgi:hypothetical protein
MAGQARRVHVDGAVHFLNMSNGLEAAEVLGRIGVAYTTMRAQSSQCEAGKPEKLFDSLPDAFMLALALGHTPFVYDYGSRDPSSGAPRALWYGMAFVRWALEIFWFDQPYSPPFLRGKDASSYFQQRLRCIPDDTRRRIKYFRQFLPDTLPSRLDIVCLYASTPNDGQKHFYSQIAAQMLSPSAETERALRMDEAPVEVWSQQAMLDALREEGLNLLVPQSPAQLQAKRERQKQTKRLHSEGKHHVNGPANGD